jgi:glycosyltransferase involved in cell wall biosynthesis
MSTEVAAQAPRLAVLTSHPIHNQAPLWRALARRLDLTVFFCTDYGVKTSYDPVFDRSVLFDTPLLEGFRHEFLLNLSRQIPGDGFFSYLNPTAPWRLASFDAVFVRGYADLTVWMAMAAAKLAGRAIYMHFDTPAFRQSNGWRQLVKKVALGPVLRSIEGCFAVGSQNRAFYERYGVRPERIKLAPYSVDNDFFQAAAARLEPQRSNVRRSLGFGEHELVVLFVGRFLWSKHPELLIEALGLLSRSEQPPVRVLIVGTGAMENALHSLAAQLGVQDRVTFAGFVNQSELPRYYVAADVFAFPAEGENWGLVVNEAMNFGLPLLLGPGVGAADDLLHDGENGYRLRSIDAAQLAAQLRTLALDPGLRRRMGDASKAIISSWGIEQAADAIAEAVKRSTGNR